MRHADSYAMPVRGAARLLARQHALAARARPSPLRPLLCRVAGPEPIEQGSLRPWLDLATRAFRACGGRTRGPHADLQLDLTLAAFAAAMAALEILDDLADGDPPAGGCQAPNLALALLGESMQLLCRLPARPGAALLALWGDMWARCAEAQALDVALAGRPDLTPEQALAVAAGSGLVTRWAVEAGALTAGAAPALLLPLRAFGEHLGAAEKLLHDLPRPLAWPAPLARPQPPKLQQKF